MFPLLFAEYLLWASPSYLVYQSKDGRQQRSSPVSLFSFTSKQGLERLSKLSQVTQLGGQQLITGFLPAPEASAQLWLSSSRAPA